MFAATRSGALDRLQDFIPASGKYSRDRNHVFPFQHPNVSRLSPAIRHRLISEREAAQAPLERYATSTVEKFTQEIYWRRYWKSWLSLRPQVWTQYRQDSARQQEDLSHGQGDRLRQVLACHSGLAIMDLFTRELRETGYLHNHARMWWAAWWVHVERLPWELGAQFFYQNLLDADPASNTLSWRWVAGLQTPGKTYLPRRSNLEKYLPSELLAEYSRGLELLETPSAHLPSQLAGRPEITQPTLSNTNYQMEAKTLLLIHEEDLSPEVADVLPCRPEQILVTADEESWREIGYSSLKKDWTRAALEDARARAEIAFPSAEISPTVVPFSQEGLLSRLKKNGTEQVVTFRPEIGPLADRFTPLAAALQEAGHHLHYLDHREDLALRPLATAGFFGFWKKLESKGLLPKKDDTLPLFRQPHKP